ALATERIVFATAIAPIYARTVEDFAHSAAYIHEVSGGRFRFGIGVAHAPSHIRMGVTPGKPLADIRAFVAKLRSYDGIGALPPNYRNYWKEAGYEDEMAAIEAALADGRQNDLPSLMSDRWLADATLFGSAAAVRDGVAAWREAGVTTPILVPSSAIGNQLKA